MTELKTITANLEPSDIWPLGYGVVATTVGLLEDDRGFLLMAAAPDDMIREDWLDQPEIPQEDFEKMNGPRTVLAFKDADAIDRMINSLQNLRQIVRAQAITRKMAADNIKFDITPNLLTYIDNLSPGQIDDIHNADEDDVYCRHFANLYYDDQTDTLVDAHPAHHDEEYISDEAGGTRWFFTPMGKIVRAYLEMKAGK